MTEQSLESKSSDDDSSRQKDREMDDLLTLEKTLLTLPTLLKKRQEELDRREEALRKAEERFAKESGNVYGDDGDVLSLNIGGTVVSVLRRTLCRGGESMLASRFSGRWDDGLEKDKDGNFFIDQPYELFSVLLNHLRALEICTPNGPTKESPTFEDYKTEYDFYRLVEYYGLTPIIYPMKITGRDGAVVNDTVIGKYPDLSVDASKWRTLKICRDGHSRKVKSFQVQLGKVERFLIGWAEEYFSFDDTKGIGEETFEPGKSAIALDCCSSKLLLNGTIQDIGTTLQVEEGTVIRCEFDPKYSKSKYTWTVDGKDFVSDDMASSFMYPVFSAKGKWQVTEIVLENNLNR